MSYFQIHEAGTPGVPDIEFIAGNTGGAVPGDAAFTVNILGDSGSNLTVTGTPLTSTLVISSTNVLNGTGTTVGNTTADLITFSLGGTPKCYKFRFEVAGFNSSTPAGCGYQINATVRTTGAAATVISIPDGDTDEDAAIEVDSDWTVVASGNNAILRVTGTTGLTINWVAQGYYISAS